MYFTASTSFWYAVVNTSSSAFLRARVANGAVSAALAEATAASYRPFLLMAANEAASAADEAESVIPFAAAEAALMPSAVTLSAATAV